MEAILDASNKLSDQPETLSNIATEFFEVLFNGIFY